MFTLRHNEMHELSRLKSVAQLVTEESKPARMSILKSAIFKNNLSQVRSSEIRVESQR